ncbi:hypothetical protein [Staphylococcus auricularis]|uniref:hypothetical protein n=1 Tax=Staphylococcus auricularis TaxID=29379 RepID=UPI001248B61E|nr:hypothetical protein [Staphylococcus auricularis]
MGLGCKDVGLGITAASFVSEMGKGLGGIEGGIVDDEGNEVEGNGMGKLGVKKGWGRMMEGIWDKGGKYEC